MGKDPIAGLRRDYPWIGSAKIPVIWAGQEIATLSIPGVFPCRKCAGMLALHEVEEIISRGRATPDCRPIPRGARAYVLQGNGELKMRIEVMIEGHWVIHAEMEEA